MFTSAHSSIPAIPRPRPKGSVVLAYAICPILLLVSFYGFWQWFKLPGDTKLMSLEEIYYLICLVVIPMVLFLFFSVVAAQRMEYNKLSGSYQARLDQLQKRLNTQEDFLHSMTDINPQAISIFDKDNNYWFVNSHAAKDLGCEINDVIGKPLVKMIMPPEKARKLEGRVNQVRNSGWGMETLDQITDASGKVHFIQLQFKPVAPFGDFSGGIMMREEDVTNLIVEREKRENMLRQVIGTLVAVVDRRDPYAAGHSARVGQLSRAIAEEMTLTDKEIEAAEIAGSLMNFGKVLVPREILTKTGPLTPDELQRVRESILTSADILAIIDFTGPVVATLKQVLERFDGTGAPEGLKGEQILITARIVMVANAYVALVSPRAHRPSLDFKDAVQNMMKDADKAFDRKVVLALANYVENRPNKLDWLTVSKPS